MNLKKWLVSAITLTFALGTIGAVTAFALTSDGGSDNPEVPNDGDTAGEVLHGDPTYEQWLSDFGDGKVATSIDDIDPNVCNWIHNINACPLGELEDLGIAPVTGSVAVGGFQPVSKPAPGTVVAGKPEPLFENGEPKYEVQSYEEAVKQDCDLAGGAFWASSDGKVGCDIVSDLENGGQGETKEPPPTVIPQVEPSAG